MFIKWLELHDFRNYGELRFEPAQSGITLIVGDNGQGKTSLIEAICYLVSRRSFRGASKETVISYDSNEAIIRAGFSSSQKRDILLEASLSRTRRDRFLFNKQSISKVSESTNVIPITVFAAQDIDVVRGAPAMRRDFLDGCVATLYPRGSSVIAAVERVLRQRAMLLKQSGGVLTPEISSTLDVWDSQLSQYGSKLVEFRQELVSLIAPYVNDAYRKISGTRETISLNYRTSWTGELRDELVKIRKDDLRKQANGLGPHRDELDIELDSHSVRHNGSQGEQRTAAYALKVAFHSMYKDRTGEDPILLLDDVFSELDSSRSEAILNSVLATQTIMTTTGDLPGIVHPALKITVNRGVLVGTVK